MADNEKPASQEEAAALEDEAANKALDSNDPNFVGPVNENAATGAQLEVPVPEQEAMANRELVNDLPSILPQYTQGVVRLKRVDTLSDGDEHRILFVDELAEPIVKGDPIQMVHGGGTSEVTNISVDPATGIFTIESATGKFTLNPKENTKVKTPEQIADAELKAGLDALMSINFDIRKQEEARLESRYPGRFGKLNRWMDQSNAGKIVKTVVNVGIGLGEVAGSAALVGTPGLLAAPALFGDGVGRVTSAIMEAGQFWLGKDKHQRLNLETKNAEIFEKNEDLKKIQAEYAAVENMTPEQARGYYDKMSGLVNEIMKADQEILKLHNENVDTKNRDKNWRVATRVVVTLAVGGLHGIPLGHQTFAGAGHAVRAGMHGFDYILGAADKATVACHGYLMGSVGHAVGPTMSALGKWGVMLGAIGVGIGAAREAKKSGHIEQAPLTTPDYSLTPPVQPNIEPSTPGLTSPDVTPIIPEVVTTEPTPEEMKKTIEENNKRIAEIGKERTAKSTELNEAADKAKEEKSTETTGKTHNIDLKIAVLNGVVEGKEPATPDMIPDGTFSDDEKSKMAEINKLKERSGENGKEKTEAIKKRKNLKERKETLDGSKEADEARLAAIKVEQDANKEKIASPDLAADRDAVNQLEDANAKLNVEIDEIDAREEERKTVDAEFTQANSELGTLAAEEDEINETITSTQEELNKSIQTKIEDLKNEQGTLIDEMKKFMEATDAKLKTDLAEMMAPLDAEEKKLQDENAALQAKLSAPSAPIVETDIENDEENEEDGGIIEEAAPAAVVEKKEENPAAKPANGEAVVEAPVVAEAVVENKAQTPETQPDAQKFAEFFSKKLQKINDPKLSFEERQQIQADTFNALDKGELVLPQGVDLAKMTSSNVSEAQMDAMRLILALPDPSYKINLDDTNRIINAGKINAQEIVRSSDTQSGQSVEHNALFALAGKLENGTFQAGGAIDKFKDFLRTNESKFKAEVKDKEDAKTLVEKQAALVTAKADLDAFVAEDPTRSGITPPEMIKLQVDGEASRKAAIAALEAEIAALSKKPEEVPADAAPEVPAAAAASTEEPEVQAFPNVQP